MPETDIASFEKFFRAKLLALPEVVACVGGKVFNSFAAQISGFPFLIFTVIPLEDSKGQAGVSLQTRLLVDAKIVTTLPVPATVYSAQTAIKDYFGANPGHDYNGFRISITHERPISYTEKGATDSERIINRGGTYRVWIS